MTTIENVHAAADQINARGDKPTYANVRTLLGGGSYSTIAAGLKNWEPKSTVNAAEPAPARVTEAATLFTSRLWNEALALAKEQADRKLVSISTELAEVSANVDVVVSENENLLAEIERLKGEVTRHQASAANWRKTVAARDQDLATARGEVDALRMTVNQISAAIGYDLGAATAQSANSPEQTVEPVKGKKQPAE